MSTPYSPTTGSARSPFSTPRTIDSAAIFEALADADCRRILEATSEESLTAKELVRRCDIPSSTVYRKLETVTDAGLLEERVRIARDGKHASEYRRCFEDLTVSLEGDVGVQIDVAPADAEDSSTSVAVLGR